MCAETTGGTQTIACLRQAVPKMASEATAAGIELLDAPPREVLLEAMRKADIVQIHLWNSPDMIELLEADLPASRVVVWPQVAGHTPPQVLHPTIFSRATMAVANSPTSARWIASSTGTEPPVIHSIGGWDRVEGVTRSSRDGFNVGYLGSVSTARMHPEYVAMSAAVTVRAARFILYGGGDMERIIPRQAEELGAAGRFELRGQIGQIGRALADFDVFGYPLHPGTSASSDLSVKEALFAGVPPVVLPIGGSEDLVEDGATGLVVQDPAEYPKAVERLHADAEERARLSSNARQRAAERWSPSTVRLLWEAIHEQVMEMDRRDGPLVDPPSGLAPPGAARFVQGLGEHGEPLEQSLNGSAGDSVDAAIQSFRPQAIGEDGGLLDYRGRYPDDPLIAVWTGIFLLGQNRRALALAEFTRAQKLGVDPSHVRGYLERATVS